MNSRLTRRSFIGRGACAGCSLLLGGGNILALSDPEKAPLDPKEFTYCGYKCTPECPLQKATLEDDTEGKRKEFEKWGMGEKHNVEFDPDVHFCYGCKNEDMPRGFIVTHCTIIPCAREKGYDCCFQCKELAGCQKDLYVSYPEHREHVLKLQDNWFASLE